MDESVKTHCPDCGVPSRSLSARDCGALDCPLKLAGFQPAISPSDRQLWDTLARQWFTMTGKGDGI